MVFSWGESAGAISAAFHMVANNGNNEGLFRGAFMESGAPIAAGDLASGQPEYDAIVEGTGCSGASDTLQCLREVPYSTLKAVVDEVSNLPGDTVSLSKDLWLSRFSHSHQALHAAYAPRQDGVFLTDSPQLLVQRGIVANVPFVSGVCKLVVHNCCQSDKIILQNNDDEGTLFSLTLLNIT
jgi:acetylcholinesterase